MMVFLVSNKNTREESYQLMLNIDFKMLSFFSVGGREGEVGTGLFGG